MNPTLILFVHKKSPLKHFFESLITSLFSPLIQENVLKTFKTELVFKLNKNTVIQVSFSLAQGTSTYTAVFSHLSCLKCLAECMTQ